MYEAFDFFLGTETWYKQHPFDIARFYRSLDKVVRLEEFNSDKMGAYMRAKFNIPSDDSSSGFGYAIQRCQENAQAVKDFLEYDPILGVSRSS